MTPTLDELEKLARGATPGKWVQGMVSGQCHMKHAHSPDVCQYDYRINADREYERRQISIPPNITLIGTDERGPILSERNAAFIAAANPETVLALVRIARAASAYVRAERYGSGEASWTAEQDMMVAVDALREPGK
jgi:hypothetical protein